MKKFKRIFVNLANKKQQNVKEKDIHQILVVNTSAQPTAL